MTAAEISESAPGASTLEGSLFLFFFFFFSFYVYEQLKASDPLGLELQVDVDHPMWILGIKLH